MISFLRGFLVGVGEDAIVLDVSGVGYHINIPNSLLEKLPRQGEELLVHTYYHHREDQVQLFGFISEEEVAFFRLLLEVSGIGPKVGLAILSTFPAKQLERAIVTEDMMVLTRIPGIGRKTAQRLVIELRDKLLKQGLRTLSIGKTPLRANIETAVTAEADSASTTARDSLEANLDETEKTSATSEKKKESKKSSLPRPPKRKAREEALEALQALGYSANEAKDALIELSATTEDSATVEEWIKGALRYLAKG
ncbi:Holliday junction branch migration protein RuvA [Heliorestis acidaminivorans]|uniref:Holliday junction branch migration protein RuvA n=1 Tax=Heliorestis acidaminivorans TaxID=553427 RepID=UPI0014784EED|nr:Holliday junction branch migration protein RuvA [Heliorestis acidaminivorans]